MHLAFFWGVLSILQCLFLPGQLMLGALSFRLNLISRLIVGAGISLAINYAIVWILLGFQIYTTDYMRIISLLFFLILFIIKAKSLWHSKIKCNFSRVMTMWNICQSQQRYKYFFILACLTILVYVMVLVGHYGHVIMMSNAISSWNPWAIDLTRQNIPNTGDYPLLVSIIISITYVIVGHLPQGQFIEFFMTIIFAIFPLGIILSIWDLALDSKKPIYLLAVVLIGLVLHSTVRHHIGSADALMLLTFLGISAISFLIKARILKLPVIQALVIATVIAGACAVAKQGGLWLLIVFPILTNLLLIRATGMSARKQALVMLLQYLWLAVFSSSWYVWNVFLQHQGLAATNFYYLTGLSGTIYHHLTFVGRVLHAFSLFNPLLWGCLVLTIWGVWHNRDWRWITVLFTVPYTIIWLCGFSYDIRNLTLSLPFWGISGAIGLEQLLSFQIIQRSWQVSVSLIKRINVFIWLVVVVLLILILACLKPFSAEKMLEQQAKKSEQIINPSLTSMLLGYKQIHGLQGHVLASWDYLYQIPALSPYYLHMGSPTDILTKFHDHEYQYLLVNQRNQQQMQFVNKLLSQGYLEPVSYTINYVLYQVVSN